MKEKIEFLNEGFEASEKKIKESIFKLRCMKNSLVKHNRIVEVGAYTVTSKNVDGVKVAELEITNTPSQWCKDGVKEILKKASWKNYYNDTIEPKVYTLHEWYRKELKEALGVRKTFLNALLNL